MMSSWCVFLFICVYIIKFLWGPDDEDDDYLCAKKHFAHQGGSKMFHETEKRIRRVASLNFNAATLFVSPFLETDKTNPFAKILPCLKAGVIKKPLFIAIFSICHY